MPYAASAVALLCESLTKDLFLLRLECPSVAADAEPGQFLFLRSPRWRSPLLPRAFSIADVLGDRVVELVIRRVGRGTAALTSLAKKETLTVVGPLGKGFDLSAAQSDDVAHLLVAGGVGVAPLLFLAKRLRGEKILLYGAQTASDIALVHRFERYGVDVRIATEDGAAGRQGLVTDLLRDEGLFGKKETRIYACGPEPMLQAVAEFALARNVWCELSVESRMACGIGACYGCVREIARNDEKVFLRVCKEGPVFSAAELSVTSARG